MNIAKFVKMCFERAAYVFHLGLERHPGRKGGVMIFEKRYFLLAAFCLFVLFACGTMPIEENTWLDTPANHVNNGNILLKAGKVDDAFREFSRAKELDVNYPPAYVGLSLIYGVKGDDETSSMYMKKAINLLKEQLNK